MDTIIKTIKNVSSYTSFAFYIYNKSRFTKLNTNFSPESEHVTRDISRNLLEHLILEPGKWTRVELTKTFQLDQDS